MKHYAVFGSPIHHSRSPEIYDGLFKKYGVDAEFGMVLMDERGLPRLRNAAKGLSGFALTMPLKRAALPFFDELSPEAAACGAVNIAEIRDGRFIGHNTDGVGAADALLEQLPGLSGLTTFMIGRGGAALAAAAELRKRGCTVIHLVRDIRNNGEELIKNALTGSMGYMQGVLINASPLGMGGGSFPYIELLDTLSPSAVLDMVYLNGIETELIREAKNRGITAIAGDRMLICQALHAFRIWTGVEAEL